jgi:hypothetical protein
MSFLLKEQCGMGEAYPSSSLRAGTFAQNAKDAPPADRHENAQMFHVEHLTFTLSYSGGLQAAVVPGVVRPQGSKRKSQM